MMRNKLKAVSFYVFMTVFGITALAPFLWMVSSSLKTKEALRTIPIRWIPERPTIDAYIDIIQSSKYIYDAEIINSIIIAVT